MLAALGHSSIDGYMGDGVNQRDAVRQAMLTEFDVPALRVKTDDGYDPSLDNVIDWVIRRTRG